VKPEQGGRSFRRCALLQGKKGLWEGRRTRRNITTEKRGGEDLNPEKLILLHETQKYWAQRGPDKKVVDAWGEEVEGRRGHGKKVSSEKTKAWGVELS